MGRAGDPDTPSQDTQESVITKPSKKDTSEPLGTQEILTTQPQATGNVKKAKGTHAIPQRFLVLCRMRAAMPQGTAMGTARPQPKSWLLRAGGNSAA